MGNPPEISPEHNSWWDTIASGLKVSFTLPFKAIYAVIKTIKTLIKKGI